MSIIPIQSLASSRGARMLRTALGPEIAAWLEEPSVIEVMLNPDGRLWIDRLGAGIADTGIGMSPTTSERIIRLVAHHVGAEVHAKAPRVSAELPDTGERFEGLLPPVVAAPSFAIRKPAVAVFTLADYVAVGTICRGFEDDDRGRFACAPDRRACRGAHVWREREIPAPMHGPFGGKPSNQG